MEGDVLSRERDARGALCEHQVFLARNVNWSVASVGQCSIPDAVAHLHPSQHSVFEVFNITSTFPAVFDAYDVDLEAGGDLDSAIR